MVKLIISGFVITNARVISFMVDFSAILNVLIEWLILTMLVVTLSQKWYEIIYSSADKKG